ncbi:CvpA family protein [Calycomorphotria hydatis]|uniref:Colicin V production protein n=1 Tax=Calycomorphotria hydatis TaxID=2528027 RepID=A0A517TCD0_9PLAN|nr:CvpA family protein [Calycomorphotria hydatis]QDT66023.1 Colicin V production protein [Calycomorphotria hydatis]
MWYDLAVVALLVFCIARGAARGFIWQVAGIAGLLLSFLFAESLSPIIAPLIAVKPPLNRWIAMFLIYIGASFVSFAVARSLRQGIEKWKFEEYDRHLGMVFGFLKGAGFAMLITFFSVTLSDWARPYVMKSYSGYAAAYVMWNVQPVMPEELAGVLDPYLKNFDPPLHDSDGGFGEVPFIVKDEDKDNELPFDFPEFPSTNNTSENNPGKLFEQMISNMASKWGSQMIERVRKTFEQVPEDRRSGFVQELNQVTQDERGVESLLRLWAPDSSKPSTSNPLQNDDFAPLPEYPSLPDEKSVTTNNETVDSLLHQIAEVYSDNENAQRSIISEAQRHLSSVPDQIVKPVLADWKADLLDQRPDPDPDTDLGTPLDVRISRQLKKMGQSFGNISSDFLNFPR